MVDRERGGGRESDGGQRERGREGGREMVDRER